MHIIFFLRCLCVPETRSPSIPMIIRKSQKTALNESFDESTCDLFRISAKISCVMGLRLAMSSSCSLA